MDEVVTFLDFFICNTMFFSSPFLRVDCTTCMYTVNDYMNKKLTRSNTGKRRMSRPELFIKERNEKNGIKIYRAVMKQSAEQAEQVAEKTVSRKRLLKFQHRIKLSESTGVIVFCVLLNMGLLGCLAFELECFGSLSFS